MWFLLVLGWFSVILDFSWIFPKCKFHFYHCLWEVSDIIYIHKPVFSTVKWSCQDLGRTNAEGSKNTRLVCKPEWGVGENSARGQLGIKAHNSSTFSGLILPLKYHLSTTPWFLVFLTLTLPVRLTIYLLLIWRCESHLLHSLLDFLFAASIVFLNLDLWVLDSRLILDFSSD